MPVTRRYECTDCGANFTNLHLLSSEPPLTDCPHCAAPESVETRPTSFNINGVKSKAVDATYRIMEEQAGVTDLKDNNRPGDTVAVAPPPIQQAESDVITRELAGMEQAALKQQADVVVSNLNGIVPGGYKGFFNNKAAMPAGQAAQVAAHGAAVARHEGSDPIAMLHKSKENRKFSEPKVIARTDKAGNVMGKVNL